MTEYAAAERAAIADLLDSVGADAPTLCAGWTAADLAAHIVLRERRPWTSAGILVKPLAGWTEGQVHSYAAGRPYPELVEELRQGPPAWAPFALPVVREQANRMEFVIHHEDLRRARPGWTPRVLDGGLLDAVWGDLTGLLGKGLFRRSPVGVVLRRSDTGDTEQVKAGDRTVTVSGDPIGLAVLGFNRTGAAGVDYDGAEADVQALQDARLGM